MKKIRILVIDDSAYNRRTISKMLEGLPDIEVIGYAVDGEEGIRKVIDLKPDMVTLDLEMPKMDGFTFLRIVMSRRPTPVVVISSRGESEGVFKALELGAVDFVVKPANATELATIAAELRTKVSNVFNMKAAAVAREASAPRTAEPAAGQPAGQAPPPAHHGVDVIAIGSSTGGPPALQAIFAAFTHRLPLSIVVSQHMPPRFTKAFAERLNRSTGFEVREAKDGDKVREGRILIAPGGKNLLFQKEEDEVVARIAEPSPGEKYLPSVDAMFASCAEVFSSRVLGVVLTGMGNDGSRGVRAIKSRGGQVIAESEETAVVFGMPREAIATGTVDRVVRLDKVAREIIMRSRIIPDLNDFDNRS
jgi:two-component system, chemotaxis family, protein-glutamate methylesterase/glutaminase